MPSLIENQTLLQYLVGASRDIGSGNPIGTNVNNVTEQLSKNINYVKVLSHLLSNGGKISMDGQNINIKAPQQAFGGGQNDTSELASPQENIGLRDPQTGSSGFDVNKITPVSARGVTGPGGVTPGNNSVMAQILSGGVNPSASPLDIPAADLAGLTTQDLSQAASLQLGHKQLERQKVNDVIDRQYKLSLMRTAQSNANAKLIDAMRTSPLDVPGVGKVSFQEWKTLPNDVKAYAYYAYDAKNRITQGHFPAGEEVLTFNEFIKQADPASLEQYYKLANEDPEFRKFYFESKRAGGTNINIGDREREKAAVKAETFIDSPTGMTKFADDIAGSDEYQDILFGINPDGTKAGPDDSAAYLINKLEGKMKSLYGPDSIQNVELAEDGKTMTWTVVMPEGGTRSFTYAIRN